MSNIKIYTDGGCIGNPGPGGWAYVLVRGGSIDHENGAVANTTNNRMELTAVIRALSRIGAETGGPEQPELEVYTDSQYVRNGITGWISTWRRNGWRTSDKKPVKNQELWTQLSDLAESLNIEWNWLRGHAGNPMNELCDRLVHEAIDALQ